MSAERFAEAFWAKVDQGDPTECWPWRGYVAPSGHGQTMLQYVPMYAHRKAWILTHGRIRSGLCVNHRCDNKLCCNPMHMYLGTRADNMIDRWTEAPPEERGQRPHRTALTPIQLGELYEMRAAGAKLQECAEKFGVHVATVCRYVTDMRRGKLASLKSDRLSRDSR
jgi:hypothetical protein